MCHGSTPGSALVAIYNYTALQVDKVATRLDPVNPYADEESLKEGVFRVLMQARDLTFSKRQATNQFCMEKLGLFAIATRLNPANHRCGQTFTIPVIFSAVLMHLIIFSAVNSLSYASHHVCTAPPLRK